MTQVIFILLLAASVAFFARTIWLFGRAVATGVSDPRPRLDDIPGRLMDVGIYFFGQKKVAEEGPQHRTSKHHLIIFWGFMVITIATVDVVVSGVAPGVSLELLPGFLYRPLYVLIDVMNLGVTRVEVHRNEPRLDEDAARIRPQDHRQHEHVEHVDDRVERQIHEVRQ